MNRFTKYTNDRIWATHPELSACTRYVFNIKSQQWMGDGIDKIKHPNNEVRFWQFYRTSYRVSRVSRVNLYLEYTFFLIPFRNHRQKRELRASVAKVWELSMSFMFSAFMTMTARLIWLFIGSLSHATCLNCMEPVIRAFYSYSSYAWSIIKVIDIVLCDAKSKITLHYICNQRMQRGLYI